MNDSNTDKAPDYPKFIMFDLKVNIFRFFEMLYEKLVQRLLFLVTKK